MGDGRRNPEEILRLTQEEESKEQRGKLKIYLGAAPGVGKTFSMLQDAFAKRRQGLDVVVGVVETHGRAEVDEMLKEFEILPRQSIEYREQKLTEFDLDGSLKRNPALILIDEMAHTNVPGSRHAKRWQDIKEILDRGIDVYTTLNVQHVESLNDVVSQIIHSRVIETVPDAMLEMADTIELVDLPPEELLKRLQEGKVYIPKQAALAAEHFFRKGNLAALRELALRVTAERVNAQVLLYRQGRGIKHIWPTREKILVCVGVRPESAKLIRAARRLATKLQAEWMAIHVDTPQTQLSEAQNNMLQHNMRLAEKFGAETRILSGLNVVQEIMNFAREQNITLIMVWKQIRSRWRDFLFSSLADELTRASGEIDVHIITSEKTDMQPLEAVLLGQPAKRETPTSLYTLSVLMVLLATIINFFIFPYSGPSNIIMVYLLAVLFVALFGEWRPSLAASILSVIAYDFFFVPPYYKFGIPNFQYFFTLLVMLVVLLVISYMTVRTRRQVESARISEHYTAALHTLSKQLASTRGVDKLLGTAVDYIGEFFKSDVAVLLPEDNILHVRASYGDKLVNPKEMGVAQWVYDLGEVAGLGTDTLPFSDALYLPLMALQGTVGVLRVQPLTKKQPFDSEQMYLLENLANQIALALEVDRLYEKKRETELQSESNRERSTLLEAVSHDLRTPVVAVMGAASTLMEMHGKVDLNVIKKLSFEIYTELEELNRLINNLLQMIYLEAESVNLQIIPQPIKPVIINAIKVLANKLENKQVSVLIPDNFPEIAFDPTLLEQVFINLIDNAIKYTPPDSAIAIIVELYGNNVRISVEDQGPGIKMDEVDRIFEKFYRGRKLTTERGLGLGLPICRSIIKAHGGEIWAENLSPVGAAFRFIIPANREG